jgi:type I restriction enzyme M protein
VANGTPLDLESKLWAAADALRNNMDAAEYKHVVLGLIFLKYISDAFEAKHAELATQKVQGADPEDPDEYRAATIFWVPKEARWSHLKDNAPQPTIGKFVDDAMSAIERDNPSLKGVLPKDFARPGLDKKRLGQLINLVSDIGLGSPADRAKDVLGQVYEYFLAQLASAEGKKDGQFYTPSRVVRVLVEVRPVLRRNVAFQGSVVICGVHWAGMWLGQPQFEGMPRHTQTEQLSESHNTPREDVHVSSSIPIT